MPAKPGYLFFLLACGGICAAVSLLAESAWVIPAIKPEHGDADVEVRLKSRAGLASAVAEIEFEISEPFGDASVSFSTDHNLRRTTPPDSVILWRMPSGERVSDVLTRRIPLTLGEETMVSAQLWFTPLNRRSRRPIGFRAFVFYVREGDPLITRQHSSMHLTREHVLT